jgi:integrase
MVTEKKPRAPRGSGCVYERAAGRWWFAYSVNGKRFHERGGTTREEAQKALRRRLAKVECQQFIEPKNERLTVDQLLDALAVSLELKGARSIGSFKSHVKPIRKEFGYMRAINVTADMVEKYSKARLKAGYAKATVNRGLQGLRASLRLAVKQNRLIRAQYIPMLNESDNVRQVWVEREMFDAILLHLPPDIADLATFAHLSGWRPGSFARLRWGAIDLEAHEVRIPTSKNKKPQSLPLVGELWDLIQRRKDVAKFRPSDFVFGPHAGSYLKPWQRACVKVGLGRWMDCDGNPVEKEVLPDRRRASYQGLNFYDLKRSAVRDMGRAGVSETVAMSITGQKTPAMFRRYDIVSQVDKADALHRVAAYRKRADNPA